MDRAWELAQRIMKRPRAVRRLTSQVIKRPWKKLLVEDFPMHIATELYGIQITGGHKEGQGGPTMRKRYGLKGNK